MKAALHAALKEFTDTKKLDLRRSSHQQLSYKLACFVMDDLVHKIKAMKQKASDRATETAAIL